MRKEKINKYADLIEDVKNLISKKDIMKEYFGGEYPYHQGIFKENLIRNLIKERLNLDLNDNNKIKIGSGFIYEQKDIRSNQIDILVYLNKKSEIYENISEDFVIIKPSIVLAALEIKSKFSKATMTSALYNIESIIKFNSNRDFPILTGILAFEQNTSNFRKNFPKWINDFYLKNKKDRKIIEGILNAANNIEYPMCLIELHKHFPNLICNLTGDFLYCGLDVESKPSYFFSSIDENITSFHKFYIELLRLLSIYFKVRINAFVDYNLYNLHLEKPFEILA